MIRSKRVTMEVEVRDEKTKKNSDNERFFFFFFINVIHSIFSREQLLPMRIIFIIIRLSRDKRWGNERDKK